MQRTNLTAERLRELLDYDPETGAFTWRVFVKGCRGKGTIAGFKRADGYIVIRVDKVSYLAHRLAWLFVTGAWPKDMIDHADRDTGNNAWGNLRAASRSQNMANQRTRARLKGVSYSARDKRWFGRIMASGTVYSSGYMTCPAAAHLWYVVEANIRFGEFARAA